MANPAGTPRSAISLSALQGCARDRPVIMSKSQGGHAPHDDPRVGLHVVERSLSFFASGNASTGFLQHFGEGAVVVELWKLSAKARCERQQNILQTCAEGLTELV